MGKHDIRPASIEDFFYWINERHRIWIKRDGELSKPWTEDEIFLDYKFTNVFRQLDRGTLALNKMLRPYNCLLGELTDKEKHLIVFNIAWYRLFNLDIHAEFGWVTYPPILYAYLRNRWDTKRKVFTSAHMTCGRPNENKLETHIKACEDFWKDGHLVVEACEKNSMYEAFRQLKMFWCVGPFIAYEIACDLRFTSLLCNATDKFTWANLGPGARRGLQRLGMPETVESMVKLYRLSHEEEMVEPHVAESFRWNDPDVPFELREIEHSLCEFDKYQRVKTGAGRPRQKYNGRAE